jgi:hypothetical protein
LEAEKVAAPIGDSFASGFAEGFSDALAERQHRLGLSQGLGKSDAFPDLRLRCDSLRSGLSRRAAFAFAGPTASPSPATI